MPQLSLYLDKTTLKMLEKAAKINNTSVSKWVRDHVVQALRDKWPDGYFQLFGAVDDISFGAPSAQETISLTPRVQL